MGRDAMGINHREGGRAPAMHRRQARETEVRGQMWMVELSVTQAGGWCGAAFLWDHSLITM